MTDLERRYQVWASLRIPAAVQDPGRLTEQELLKILADIEETIRSVFSGHLPIPYSHNLLKIEDADPPRN